MCYRTRKKIIQVSKYTFYAFAFHCAFASLVMATDTASSQALSSITIKWEPHEYALEETFQRIAEKTGLQFFYNSNAVPLSRKTSITHTENLRTMLQDIANQHQLEFHRIQQIISVKKGQGAIMDSTQQALLEKMLTGRITDADTGEPLVGATVVVKESTLGTITNTEGKFELSVPDETQTIMASYIGYLPQEIPIRNQNRFTVALSPDVSSLNEVVVVGYGTQQRANLAGAVTSIDSEVIEGFPATSVEQSLVGNVPGVHIVQSSGAPGAGISIRVRGVTSIAGGNEPLYVVDGVPFFNNDVQGLNGISAINPANVASIEILKDAAATAIYGSRGGNGVVLITTKSGTVNAPTINYSTWFRIDNSLNQLDMMNAAQFSGYAQQWSANSNQEIPEDFLRGGNTDWQDEITQTALSHNHDLTFAGGGERSRYYVGLGYLDQAGIVTNSSFQRYSAQLNMENTFNDYVSLQTSLFGNHSVQQGVVPAQNNNTFSISKTAIGASLWSYPTIPIRNSEGEYSAINSFVENPVLYVDEVLDQATVDRWLGSTTLKIELLEGLTNHTRLGVDFTNINRDQYFPRTLRIVLGGEGAAIAESTETLNYVAENFLEYNQAVSEKLYLEGLIGASIQREQRSYSYLEGAGFISDDLRNNAIQAAQNPGIPITALTEQSIASLFGRIQLIYQDQLILSSSVRRDGASVFSNNNKVATFPSVSLAWKVEESSLLDNLAAVNTLKLRASWGKSGNPAIQPYQSLPLGLLTTTSQGAGSDLVVGLAPNLPNQNLSWETTTQTNIGVDIGMMDNRLVGTFDYYNKQTDGALSTVQLAPSAGFNTIVDNVGEVENQGIEVGLTSILVENTDFSLSLGGNFSINRNTVTRTKNDQDISSTLSTSNGGGEIFNVIRPGEELGSFLGYQFIGLDDGGIPQYEDVNNDGTLDARDFVIIGSPFPDFLYGVNLHATYGNFSLGATFQGTAGSEVYNVMQYILTDPNDVDFNRLASVYKYYPNPSVDVAHRASSRYVEDASYFRLRTVRLGYDLALSKAFVKQVNFYVSGQNLFTLTDYTGYDPEVNSFNGNSLNQGIDLSAYPSTRSYTLGLNLTF